MDIYEDLLQQSSELREAQEVEESGMDAFFLPDKIKVASLGDLSDFFRTSADTLVHKAKKDLWRISEDKDGNCIIERLFDDSKKPIRV